jgi:hypothetical protein
MLKMPETVPPFRIYFHKLERDNFTLQFYTLYPLSKAHVNTKKKLHFSRMSSGFDPSPQSSVPVRLLPVFVSSKQAASVDAKVWGVTFSPSSVPLV